MGRARYMLKTWGDGVTQRFVTHEEAIVALATRPKCSVRNEYGQHLPMREQAALMAEVASRLGITIKT